MKHHFTIPGLDRQYCGNCQKWVCRPGELERLKKLLDKSGSKKIQELQREWDKEKWLSRKANGQI